MIDYIKSVSGQLTRRVIFAYAFKWGAYGAVLAVLLELFRKLFLATRLTGAVGQADHALPVTVLIVPIALLIGAIIGILNRPSLIQTAIYLDRKLNTNDHLSTLLECLNKAEPNPVEATLIHHKDTKNYIPVVKMEYKFSYLILFLIAVITLIIIQQTPIPAVNSGEIPDSKSQITNNAQMSNIKTQVDTLIKTTNASARELLARIEQLVREMEQGTVAPSLILEKLNEFSRTAQGLPPDDKDTVKVQALLDKLQEYCKISAKGQNGFTRATESAQGGNGAPGNTGGNNPPSHPPFVKGGQGGLEEPVTAEYLKKLYEEAIARPYWPSEYNEVIKKYFSNQ